MTWFYLQYTASQKRKFGDPSHHLAGHPYRMAVKPQRACGRQDGLSVSLLECLLVGHEARHDHCAAKEVMAIRKAVFHAAVVQILVGVEYV